MYAVFCVFRYLMALFTSSYPIVMIDEILYYSLARSIGAHGRVTFMGQPANYNSILYPFLLSPLYWLPEGTNYYRIIQLVNVLVFNLALFPIFFLARRVCGSRRRALLLAFFSMLAPDFILGQLIMSECIIYPLFFLSMYLFYRYLEEKRLSDMVWFGIIGGAIFCTKPGIVVGSAAAVLFLLLHGISARDRAASRAALVSAAAAAGFTAIFYFFVSVVFNHHVGQYFGLYQNQIAASEKSMNLSSLFASAWIYPCSFILACAGGIFITPILRFGDLSDRDRLMIRIMLSSVLILLTGTAWTVNRIENDLSLHMRYTAQFIPLFLIFTFAKDAPEAEIQRRKARKAGRGAKKAALPCATPETAAVLSGGGSVSPAVEAFSEDASASPAAGTEDAGARSGAEPFGENAEPPREAGAAAAPVPPAETPGNRRSHRAALLLIPLYMLTVISFFDVLGHIRESGNVVFELCLSWLNTAVFGTRPLAVVFAVAVLLLTLVMILFRFKTKVRQWVSAGAAFAVFVCGEFTYGTLRSYAQPVLIESTDQVSDVIGGEEYLYVYSTWVYYNTALDVRSRDETFMCYVNDLYNNTLHSGGVYIPFVPNTQRGAIPRNTTPDTDLIVMDASAYNQVQLSEYAELAADTPILKAIRIQKGQRWLDSMMGGIVDGNVLRKGVKLNVALFNKELSNGKSKLKFDIDVDAETELILTMEIGSEQKSFSFTIPDYRDTYTLDIPQGTTWITMILTGSSAHLYKFETIVGK